MEGGNGNDIVMNQNGKQLEGTDNDDRSYPFFRPKEETVFPLCEGYFNLDRICNSLPQETSLDLSQRRGSKITECGMSRELVSGLASVESGSISPDISVNLTSTSSSVNTNVTPFQESSSSVREIIPSLPLTLNSVLGSPITKRGPGRPRKDRSCPVQRKKIFPGRPRVRARKGSHTAIIPLQSNQLGIHEGKIDYHHSDSLLNEAKGFDTFVSAEDTLFATDLSRSHSIDIGDLDDGQMPFSIMKQFLPEENSHDQWPGKVCAFCNLGENSSLGQGELNRYDPTPGFNPFQRSIISHHESSESENSSVQVESLPKVLPLRRQKSSSKLGRERGKIHRRSSLYSSSESVNLQPGPIDELEIIGFAEEPDLNTIFDSTGHIYCHYRCALWSEDTCRSEEQDLTNVDKAVCHGITQKCSNCRRYGATIRCRAMKCNRIYHYSCATSCGAFQDMSSLTLLCPQHISQAPTLYGMEANCVMCETSGVLTELLFCTSCGHHYHNSCLDPVIAINPIVRAGWLCPDCKTCQTCRRPPEDENKMLVCDTCDKGYHTSCLKPTMVTIPKNGWKCKNCRICGDCGARTPGSGPSSRWHMNYTVCDSCYQQRNKGVACPLCGKAYRQFSQRGEMAQCRVCRKFIHAECDSRIDQIKDGNNMPPYICPVCSSPSQAHTPVKDMEICSRTKLKEENISPHLDHPATALKDPFIVTNEDSLSSIDMELNLPEKGMLSVGQPLSVMNLNADISPHYDSSMMAYHFPRHLPIGGKFPGKKRMGVGRPRGSGKFAGKRRAKLVEFHRKRGPKPKVKMISIAGVIPFSGINIIETKDSKQDDEPTVDNKMLLCSATDEFVLTQDLCVMCGSFGRDEEGRVIACSQCGQCYHPYCVSVKLTAVILRKGWRCLDCTVCEGCGKPHDEGRLLLCDDCDISYHTYCLDPPLDEVPQGNWKCKWCVICVQCGEKSPGYGSDWQNNYTMCGPCSSEICCPVCHMNYQESDLVIQCIQCERWLHGNCDQMTNEDDAEICSECGYHCLLCRSSDEVPPHLMPPSSPSPSLPSEVPTNSPLHKVPKEPDLPMKPKPQAQFYIDGVFLSESGMHQIKSLTIEQPKKQRARRQKQPPLISVSTAKSFPDIKPDDTEEALPMETGNESETKLEMEDINHEEMVKPDMQDLSSEKKKRQRKLHKLGIGGFLARPRGRNLSAKEQCGELGSTVITLAASEQLSEVQGQLCSDSFFGSCNEGIGEYQLQEKPKRKRRVRRKNPLEDSYPAYLQEAFFGKDLLDTTKTLELNVDINSEDENPSQFLCSSGSQVKPGAITARITSQDPTLITKPHSQSLAVHQPSQATPVIVKTSCPSDSVSSTAMSNVGLKKPEKNKDVSDDGEQKQFKIKAPDTEEKSPQKAGEEEDLKDFLPLPQDLGQDDELMDILMNDGEDLAKEQEALGITSVPLSGDKENQADNVIPNNKEDPLAENIDSVLLSPHLNLDSMIGDSGLPQMDSKDVEDIIKGVLSPAEQSDPNSNSVLTPPAEVAQTSLSMQQTPSPQVQAPRPSSRLALQPAPPTPGSSQTSIDSPFSLPPPSPFHTEYGSPQLPEPKSPWLENEQDSQSHGQKNILKWETDEVLGENATISPVLYANINHPNLKNEFPSWSDRAKQIAKIWRSLPADKRQPYLQKARENRAASRMQKAQVVSMKETKTHHYHHLTKEKNLDVQEAGKVVRDQRSQREIDQERQWKQFQAIRQHQIQKQQQILQEQRAQAMLKAQQMALDRIEGSPSETSLSLSTSLPVSSTVSANAVVSPRPAEASSPMSSSLMPGSLNDMSHSQQVPTPSALSRSPSDNGSPVLPQCSLNNQQQAHHIPTQINMSPTQCSIPSPSQNLQQPGCMTRRTSTPVIQVSRVRPPIDPSQLAGSDSFPQPPDSPLLSPSAATDSFVSPHRTLYVRQPIPQVRPLFSPMANNQVPTPRPDISRPSTPTVVPVQDVFHTPPSTPHAQSTESFSQQSPTALTQLHSKDNYSQPLPVPHPSAGPFSPSQSACVPTVTHSPVEPYVQSPGTPRSGSAVSEHFVSPTGTPTSRFSQDASFSPHLQHPQSVPASPTADPYVQQSSPCPTSNLLPSNDAYNKSPNTSRPMVASTNRMIISRQINETSLSQSDQPIVVPATIHGLESEQVMARQQLRDLLQRQMKKQDQSHGVVLNWQAEQRQESCGGAIQNNSGFSIGSTAVQNATQESLRPQIIENLHRPGGPSLLSQNSAREDGFRHPYPPGLRPRLPVPSPELPFRHPSQPIEQRLASIRGSSQEARLRMLMLQQQQQQQLQIRGQQWPSPQMRMPGPRMSTGISNSSETYDQLALQRSQPLQQPPTPLEIEPIARFGQPAVCSAAVVNNTGLNMPGHLNRTVVPHSTSSVTSTHPVQTFSVGTSTSLVNTCVAVPETLVSHSVTTASSGQEQTVNTVNSSTTQNAISHPTHTPSLKHSHQLVSSGTQPRAIAGEEQSETSTSLESPSTENNEKKPAIVAVPNKLEATDSSSVDQLARRKTTAGDLVKEVEEQAAEQETAHAGEEDDELDDDELLGLGNDFNILEYADPELDKCLVGEGEKRNILDEHLDLDDKDDELESEVEEMKSRTGERKETSVDIKQENRINTDNKKKTNDVTKESPKNSPNNRDYQTKFLEFNQRDVDKKGELTEEKKSDIIVNIKKEVEDTSNITKLPTSSSVPTNLSSDVASCQQINSTFPHVALESPKVLPFSSEQSNTLHTQQPQGNIRTKAAMVTSSSPVNFGQPQAPLHHEQESRSPSQAPFAEQLRTPQPPPYPLGVPPPPPYQTHSVRPQSLPTQQQAIIGQRSILPHQTVSRPTSGQLLLSPNSQERSLLQEQPLLLEDLVEQEKREQRRQNQEGIISPQGDALLSDIEFERLKADVFSGPQDDTLSGPGSLLTSQSSQSISTNAIGVPSQRFPRPLPTLNSSGQQHSQPAWQGQHTALLNSGPSRALHQIQVRPAMMSSSIGTLGIHPASMLHGEPPVRANLPRAIAPPGAVSGSVVVSRPSFAVACLQPPPTPPSDPVTEQDRQLQVQYEQWIVQQQTLLTSTQKFLETEVGKMRKAKKALNTKQRQLRKNGQELTDHDASELARISQDQSSFQKQLDQVRKHIRQHSIVMQEYRMKQQKRSQQVATGSPGQVHPVIVGMQTSPLGTSLSPHRAGSGTPQSPMMSPSPIGPSPSPRMQHSPSPLMQNSPATLPPSPLMQQQSPLSQSSLLSQPGSHPSPGDSGQRLHQVHVLQDENNPFSESFQQREQLEKLQDNNEKCQNSSQLSFFGEETMSFSQNHVRIPNQPMPQVAILRNDQTILHHANSPLAVSQLKVRQNLPSDLVGQPFPSLSSHLQTSAHHSLSGTSVRPPPPYPHHLRPSPSPTTTHLTSLLKTESSTSCSQNQPHFVNTTLGPYKAPPPPNITPYAEMLQQEPSTSQVSLSVSHMSTGEPLTTGTSSLSSGDQHQISTKASYSPQDAIHSQVSNQHGIEQVSGHSQLPTNKEQTVGSSNRPDFTHEPRCALNQQANEKAFVHSSQCLNSHPTLQEKDLQSDSLQCKILETSRNRSILAKSPNNNVSSAQSQTLTVSANTHCSFIQEKLTCNIPDVISDVSNWALRSTSSESNITREASGKCATTDSSKSVCEVSRCMQNTDIGLGRQTKIDISVTASRESSSLLTESEKLPTSNSNISELRNNAVKEEQSSEKEWDICCKEASKETSSSCDSFLENEKQNHTALPTNIKMEDCVSASEQNSQEKPLSAASPVTSVIKDEPIHSQGAIDSDDRVSSPQIASDSASGRCSLSHTLSQSLPSSVTNTLNFTLRQTGMPTVCLSQSDSSQQSTVEKNKTHLSVEISDDKSQSLTDTCNGVKQSTISDHVVKSEIVQERKMSDGNISLCSTAADSIDNGTKLSLDLQTESTPNVLNPFVTSTPVPSNSEKISIKVEPKELEVHLHEIRSIEIKKEAVERSSCQLASAQQEEEISLRSNEEIVLEVSASHANGKFAANNKQCLQYPESKLNQQREQKVDCVMRNSVDMSRYMNSPKTLTNSNCIKPEQNVSCIREESDDTENEENRKLLDGIEGKEICHDAGDGINQNVLLKQLLQNCPSAETHRKTDHFEEFASIEKNHNALKDTVIHDDGEKLEDSRMKKLSYLDIRRAQLEKEPTPPPEEINKPKRKRTKKKKIEGKEISLGKKRARKGSSSKAEEDYETYIEAMMTQLRTLPPIRILEPNIKPNFSVCPIFGSGDLNIKESPLRGSYGSAFLPTQGDYYSTYPYGNNPPTPPASLPPTPPPFRSYYSQEFPHRTRERSRVDIPASLPTPPPYLDSQRVLRDTDSPDTIISSSSPECVFSDSILKWPGLHLIDEEDGSNDERKISSPIVPVIAPIPIRVFPRCEAPLTPSPDYDDEKDKENVQVPDKKPDLLSFKVKMVGLGGHPAPLKDSGNVAVTLTLSSAAAEDIQGVLSALADLLKIPPPTSYEIVERTATPPSQKLGLYKKSKDADVNIQTLLNGKPRFCRHCDIVVLTSGIRKKASDLLISSREEMEEDEVIFCSTNCYMQFALTHRSTSTSEKEAAAVVSHLSAVTAKRKSKCEDDKDKSCDKLLQGSVNTRVLSQENPEEKICKNLPLEGTVFRKEQQVSSRTVVKQLTEKPGKLTDSIMSLPSSEYGFDDEQNMLQESASDEEQSSTRITVPNQEQEPPVKKWKGTKWKFWTISCLSSPKYRGVSEEEMGQMLDRLNISIKPEIIPNDNRRCVLCHEVGDGETNGSARILNMDVDKWIHLNCALWSAEVYETVNGALINVDSACKRALTLICCRCHKTGASLKCLKVRCSNTYHFPCAMRDRCAFLKDKTMLCPQHLSRITNPDNELESVAVYRRVYVNRDEHKQVASMIHQGDQHLIRIGSLIFLNIGQLLPHQMPAFHTSNCIYPVGYKVIRMYWSMRALQKRCQYICSISEVDGKPEFRIQVREKGHEDIMVSDVTAKGVWQKVLEPIEKLRKQAETIKVFPNFISGEDLFGLNEPAILRILESLPGVDTLSDYNFRYGRSPFLELPLAINPTGCARAEPKLRTHFKRPHTLHTSNTSRSSLQSSLGGVEVTSPYIKQFVHSKSSQYRKMKTEWRNNVYLARSHIQGLGLYAARDIEKHTMVIEYIGQLIRNEIAERNEAIYEAQNRGVYMFRLDENRVIDATLCGGLARYMNHSCNPNCVAEVVQIDRENKILIIANRRITRGEELTYDYKFEVEDDQHKIPCLCGAPNCRKWMN